MDHQRVGSPLKSRSTIESNILEKAGSETRSDTPIDHFDLEDLVNRIDLEFSRESTCESDRKKVERFWKHLDSNSQITECLLNGPAETSASPTSEASDSELSDDDHHLSGSVQYEQHLERNKTAMENLVMLKLKHLDEVALANAEKELKVEGSPRYADEVFKENMETVTNYIKTFDKVKWGRKSQSPVKDRLTKTTVHTNGKHNVVKETEWSLILTEKFD